MQFVAVLKITLSGRGTNEENEIWDEYKKRMKGRRTKSVCGKISPDLHDFIKNQIDGTNYQTMNDVVEEALVLFAWSIKQSRINNGGGNSGM